ncbi:MAG TPA: M28 family peptidase [Sphingomonas sp.]|jgi:Zn-dependent M28 family amino/carboxypeptidase
MRRASLLIFILVGGAAAAQDAPPIKAETVEAVTRTLASDAFEGRGPGTAGEEKTVAYIAERFAAAGLKPGAADGWFQPVPIVTAVSAPGPLRFTGGKGPVELAYRTDFVANSYQVRPRLSLDGSEVVFVGYGVNAPERGWNDYAGADVRGKTVVILVNDPDWETKTLDGPFEGRAMTYYGRWTYKYEEAARQGAAAALIVHETEPAAYPWSVVTASYTGRQYRLATPNDGADQSKVIGWLTRDAAAKLATAAGRDFAALAAAAKRPGFRAVPLGLKASMTLDQKLQRQTSRNVVGILPGRERPDEYVVHMAHWDHFGRCDADATGDDICNGALDNATGVGGLVALAEAHARAGPAARSMLFLAVTAEEFGLLGSEHYARNPLYPLGKTVGGVNMDGLNVAGPTRDLVVTGPGKSELEDLFAAEAKRLGLAVKPEPTPEKGFYYRSDHFSLAKVGVPMLYAESGDDLVDGGVARGRALAERYIAERYHKPGDEYDPAWRWDGAVRDLGINYRIGRTLADGDAWPNWRPDAEFRKIRDESRAAAK